MFTDAQLVSFLFAAIVVLLVGMVAFCVFAAIGGALTDWWEGRNVESAFKSNMRNARHMMGVARSNKAQGFHYAARAAVESAKSYRAAAHASVHYAAQMKGV